jgi:hypothetical protein
MTEKKHFPGYFSSVLLNKCPRCREGFIYKEKSAYKNLRHCIKMEEECPVCGQLTELEVGFYYGTGYVSYALSIAISVVSFVLWYLIIGISLNDYRFFGWMGCNALLLVLLQPLIMRLSRTLWLSWFIKYDPNWKKNSLNNAFMDRIVKEHMGRR